MTTKQIIPHCKIMKWFCFQQHVKQTESVSFLDRRSSILFGTIGNQKNLRLAIFQLLLTEKKVLCRNNTQFPIASFLMYIICLSFSLRFHLQDAITLRNLFLCFYGIHDCSPSNIIKSGKFGNIVFNNLHVCIQFLFPPNTFIQHQRPYLDYY